MKVKPSIILKEALLALEECERSRKYNIDMGMWHMPHSIFANQCAVCLAGAVMAKRLHASDNDALAPDNFPEDVEGMLQALNCFRTGHIGGAMYELGIDIKNYQIPWHIGGKRYSDLPKDWKMDMELIVEVLEEEGL